MIHSNILENDGTATANTFCNGWWIIGEDSLGFIVGYWLIEFRIVVFCEWRLFQDFHWFGGRYEWSLEWSLKGKWFSFKIPSHQRNQLNRKCSSSAFSQTLPMKSTNQQNNVNFDCFHLLALIQYRKSISFATSITNRDTEQLLCKVSFKWCFPFRLLILRRFLFPSVNWQFYLRKRKLTISAACCSTYSCMLLCIVNEQRISTRSKTMSMSMTMTTMTMKTSTTSDEADDDESERWRWWGDDAGIEWVTWIVQNKILIQHHLKSHSTESQSISQTFGSYAILHLKDLTLWVHSMGKMLGKIVALKFQIRLYAASAICLQQGSEGYGGVKRRQTTE